MESDIPSLFENILVSPYFLLYKKIVSLPKNLQSDKNAESYFEDSYFEKELMGKREFLNSGNHFLINLDILNYNCGNVLQTSRQIFQSAQSSHRTVTSATLSNGRYKIDDESLFTQMTAKFCRILFLLTSGLIGWLRHSKNKLSPSTRYRREILH